MDPALDLTWWGAVGPVLLAAALLLVPGAIVARALGFDGLDSAGLAGPLSLCVLLVSGLLTAFAGLPWTVPVGVLVLSIVTGVSALLLRRCLAGHQVAPPLESHPGTRVGFLCGAGVAALVTGWKFISGTATPDALSQMPDAHFHLQAVQYMAEVRSANPLIAGDIVFYDPSRYPGGFHSLAATVSSWADVNVVVASHATMLVCAALIWPLGVVSLVRRVVSPSGWVLAASGLIALSAVYAPVALLALGGPWANLVSASMVPGALIPLAVVTIRPVRPPGRTLVAGGLALGASTAAAVAAQPNAAYSIALLGAALMAPTVVTWGRGWVLAYLCGVGLVVGAWILPLPPAMLDIAVVPDLSTRRAVLLLLKNGDAPLWAGGVVALMTLVGVLVSLRHGTTRGVALAWAVTFALALSLQFGDRFPVAYLTWPWWSGYGRIANVLSVATILAGSVAVSAVVRLLQGRRRVLVFCGASGLVVLAVVCVPATSSVRDLVRDSYSPQNERSYFATPDEIVDLRVLAGELDDSSIVALDPLRGGAYLNLFGPRTIPVGPFYRGTDQTDLVDAHLSEAASDPRVCDAVASLGITHVLVGGDAVVSRSPVKPAYPGLETVPSAPDFTRVAAAGDYELYTVPPQCVRPD